MTVSTDWFDELNGDNQEVGAIDAYIDVDGGGIQVNTDQMSSSNFDGGIPKSSTVSTTVSDVKPGDYVFWNISSNTPSSIGSGSTIDGEIDFLDDYQDNMFLVVDIETDDSSADPDSTTATRYLYLQDVDDVKKVSASGGSSVGIIREASISDWDGGTTGWLLTSSGNAIFGNVYARGAIYAQSGEIAGNLSFGGSLEGTGWVIDGESIIGNNPTSGTSTVKIYSNNPQLNSGSNVGVINILGSSYQTAIDANDIQTFAANSTAGSTMRLQRLGGSLIIGNTGVNVPTTINGNLTVTGTITSGGSGGGTLGNTTIDGTLTVSNAVTFNTTGTIKLGGQDVIVNISSPSATTRALNVGGNVGVDGSLAVNTIAPISGARTKINGSVSIDTTNSTYALEVGGTVNSTQGIFIGGDVAISSARNITGTTYSVAGTDNAVNDNWCPLVTGTKSLGTSSYKWSAVWATDGTINTSDINKKTDIIASDLGLDFINRLNPVRYRWKVSHNIDLGSTKEEENITPVPGKRPRYGLIAQEVKQTIDSLGIDFGGWVQDDINDDNSSQSLRYSEFISPMIKAIQELSEKINILEERLAILEG